MNGSTCCLQLLIFLVFVLQQGSSEQLLDIVSPVKATASSTYNSSPDLLLSPQLAIQADSSYVWANCFLSKNESNPWFGLQLKTVTTIFNVQLGVKTQRSGKMPIDFNLTRMANLSVYVSMSSKLVMNSETVCGSPWTYTPSRIIDLDCRRNLSGNYIHVIVPSSSPTYLIICSIVLNKDEGPPHPLDWSKERATFASSGLNSSQPPALAIDGISTSCSSVAGARKTWLRVDIQTVRYTREVRLLFLESSGAGAIIFVGRSLQNDGALGNEKCGTVSNNVTASHWRNVTCYQPILGQFIYVERSNNSMKICEIQVFYGNILNIYSPVHVTASDQRAELGRIWKPIDGVIGPAVEASWISLPSSQSWWRMEFSQRSAISKVIIYTPTFSVKTAAESWSTMNGFAVYIGDSPVGNGSENKRCGEPWVAILYSTITMTCPDTILGNYLYVAAADRPKSALYLTEIHVYGCEEPNVEILRTVSNQTQKATNLTCYSEVSKSGCLVKKIVWTGPNGNTVSDAADRTLKGTIVSSTVVVNDRALEGLYNCTVHYAGGSAMTFYNYTGLSASLSVPTVANSKASASSLSLGGSISGRSASWSISTTPKSTLSEEPIKGSSNLNVAAIVVPVIIAIILAFAIFLVVKKIQRSPSMKNECDVFDLGQYGGHESVVKSCDATKSDIQVVQQKPVEVAHFESHVERLRDNENHGFSLEYSLIGREADQHNTFAANMKCNKAKNRYPNIVPYDHARVTLRELPGVHSSDYINASYIDAYNQPKGYIACQGPTNATITDFWRMIWQEDVHTIAVVTNLKDTGGKTKCSCYWPQVKHKACYENVTVKFEEEIVLSECTVRIFKLTNSEKDNLEPRTVIQFHFTDWPDHGVPRYATSFLNFLKRVRAHYDFLRTPSPIVVHCSAGVGRTGIFIVVDYSFQKLKQEKQVDIFNLVKELRTQRPFMVQTLAQYVFCHDAVLEVMLCGNTSVEASNLKTYAFMLKETNPETGKTGFWKQLQVLNKVSPLKECFSYSGDQMTNVKKNRYSTSIPPDESRVLLARDSCQSSDSNYICAASVDGYRKKSSYITTQGPLKQTVDDFWRLIWQNDIEVIVMVTRLEDNGEEMSVQYWPSEGTEKYNLVSVTLQDEKVVEDYVIRKFSITNTTSSRIVTQFHYMTWSAGHLPDSPFQLLDMMNQIQKAQQQTDNKTVVVVCNDGVHRCGIFCAISIIIETLKTEQVVDVFQVVKALRLQNPDFVTGLMEYKFCYSMALELLECFTEYSNFKLL